MKRSTWFVLDVFLLLIFWSAITAYVPGAADVLPPVTKIASKMAEFLFSGALVRDIIVSLGRTLAGFAIAICTALPMGIALGTSPRLARAIDPLIEVLRPISPIAWIPLVRYRREQQDFYHLADRVLFHSAEHGRGN